MSLVNRAFVISHTYSKLQLHVSLMETTILLNFVLDLTQFHVIRLEPLQWGKEKGEIYSHKVTRIS